MKTNRTFANRYGRFTPDGSEYLIQTPETPRPWINVISNGDYGLTVSQTGSGYSWRTHAQLNRITRWEQDLITDERGKYLYIRDSEGRFWSAGWKPVCAPADRYRCRHGIGYSIIESRNHGVESELLMFVPNDEPLELWRVTLRNLTRRPKRLSLFSYLEWGLGAAPDWHREFHKVFTATEWDPRARAILATKRLWEIPSERGHWNADWAFTAFHSCSERPVSFDTDKESFIGMYGTVRQPRAVKRGKLARRTGKWLDPVAALQISVALKPGEAKTVCFTLGAAGSREQALDLVRKYRSAAQVELSLGAVRARWKSILSPVNVSTPDPAFDLMVNTWLKYQAISGRIWGRSAYYQTGGAYGFRDQLQDSQVFLPIDPAHTRRQILLHAQHQFRDGSVYHWWHPISENGLRNAVTDNLLWLPFVTMSYLEETAELSLLDERVMFVDDPVGISLYEHCTRAIDLVLSRTGKRGIPLIGGGDWNDGLSAVGLEMKGESVWLGHFLCGVLDGFAEVAARRKDLARAQSYRARAVTLRTVLNVEAWDGRWYYRATKDSGEKIGSAENNEGKIFLNAQTWAVISGVADADRGAAVMDAVEKQLESKVGPLLLSPAYTVPDPEIGYLTRYAPGVRENGGVYTHAATWAVLAETVLGNGSAAYRMLSKINPVNRGKNPDEYFAEPYVTPGNIDGPDSENYGRGGWTWYTGSAAWSFRVALNHLLGVRPDYDGLLVDPCVPKGWPAFTVRRMFRGALYTITVRNPRRVECGVAAVEIDGKPFGLEDLRRGVLLPVFSPGTEHTVAVTLGPRERRPAGT